MYKTEKSSGLVKILYLLPSTSCHFVSGWVYGLGCHTQAGQWNQNYKNNNKITLMGTYNVCQSVKNYPTFLFSYKKHVPLKNYYNDSDRIFVNAYYCQMVTRQTSSKQNWQLLLCVQHTSGIELNVTLK